MEDWRDKLASRKERQNRTAGFIACEVRKRWGRGWLCHKASGAPR